MSAEETIEQRAARMLGTVDPERLQAWFAKGRKPDDPLTAFVRESNKIEGIVRDPFPEEIDAHRRFLAADLSTASGAIAELEMLVSALQSGAVLRARSGLNVYVGNHVPPPGGMAIVYQIERLFNQLRVHGCTPDRAYTVHREYENLHPFTDGNGRSGRALWLRMMGGPEQVPLGFLHTWYYQSLSDGDRL